MLRISELAPLIEGARWHPQTPASSSDCVFTSVGTDSRSIAKGGLFFALSGPNFDGHEFVSAACERGAVAAVVTRAIEGARCPLLVVPDTLSALQQLATQWRSRWKGTLIAVTGSNGKTTVKQMVAHILKAQAGPDASWATPGNLNNHIGVPLSVLGLRPEHRLAVIELGMNHPGEISVLARIAQPHVALVNNAQREHQEFMADVAAVARENGEVFRSLAADGVAVFPRDSIHEPIWRGLAAPRRMIRFGFFSDPCDAQFSGEQVLAESAELSSQSGRLRIVFPDQSATEVSLQGIGRHVVLNALAASAVSHAAGCSVQSIRQGLSEFTPFKGRGVVCPLSGGGTLIDDSYNANPDSVRAAIDALTLMPRPQALVLGDMGEVGEHEEAFHEEVLRHARDGQIASIWLHGSAMHSAQSKTGIGRHFAEIEALIRELRDWIGQQQKRKTPPSIWIKGSRFMKMERVVGGLTAPSPKGALCS